MSKFENIRCSSCGSTHIENFGNRIGRCEHCKSTMLLPRPNEEIIALLNAALVYRENFNYDLAIKSYQFVLEKDSNELSAYEGILLSKYGIEYVKDAYTNKLIPTCHRAHFKSIYDDEYYKTLITLADQDQQTVINEKVKEIDKLQKAIEKQLKTEQSYDIFISYKATDKNGEKTEDSVIAREIYEELTKKNYKVFLAEKSLENRVGSEYEPIIFKALHTSKIFVLVGTEKENIEANWVRNEWSRFIDRIKNNEDLPKGCFIPVFKNMNPYDMPKVNNTFVQGVDAGKIGYLITLVDGITKLLKPEKEQKVLETFDNIDNFAEFERIKKERKKELKQKRWEQLKQSKGPKKWFYMAFLYSPYLFGIISIIMSFFKESYFSREIAFWVNMAVWSIAVILTVVTICVHIPKFGCKPFINIINPWMLIIISTLLYQVIIAPPMLTDGHHRNFWDAAHIDKGIVFCYDIANENSNNQKTKYWEDIVGLLEKDYLESVKIINGKKTLILPNEGRKSNIRQVYITLPNDIECLVLPQYVNYSNLKINNNSSLKEIYCYGDRSDKSYSNVTGIDFSFDNEESFPYITIYYESLQPSVYLYNISNEKVTFIQQDLEYYN